MLASVERVARHGTVQVVGQADVNRVDLLDGQQIVVVGEDVRDVVLSSDALSLIFAQVGHPNELHFRHLAVEASMRLANHTGANDTGSESPCHGGCSFVGSLRRTGNAGKRRGTHARA